MQRQYLFLTKSLLTFLIFVFIFGIHAADSSLSKSTDKRSNFECHFDLGQNIVRYVLQNNLDEENSNLQPNPWHLPSETLIALYDEGEARLARSIEKMVAQDGIDPRSRCIVATKNKKGDNPLHIVARKGTDLQALVAARVMYSTHFLSYANHLGQTPIGLARSLRREDIASIFANTPLNSDF